MRRIACCPLRPLVESGSGKPSHRPRIPHRAKEKRDGTPHDLQKHFRRTYQRHDTAEETSLRNDRRHRRKLDRETQQ